DFVGDRTAGPAPHVEPDPGQLGPLGRGRRVRERGHHGGGSVRPGGPGVHVRARGGGEVGIGTDSGIESKPKCGGFAPAQGNALGWALPALRAEETIPVFTRRGESPKPRATPWESGSEAWSRRSRRFEQAP